MPGCAARCRQCRNCRASVASAHVRSASRYYEANDMPKAMAHFGRAMEYGVVPTPTGLKPYSPTPKEGSFTPSGFDWRDQAGEYYYDGGKFVYEYMRNPVNSASSMCDTIQVWLALYTPGDAYGTQPMLRARAPLTLLFGTMERWLVCAKH